MSRYSVLLLCLLAGVCSQPAGSAEDIGRLFLTPQQRQDLDRRRTANIQEAMVVTESTSAVQGRVLRSSGKTTTWVNRSPQHDAYPDDGPASVTLSAGEGQADVKLKVGETYDNVRGEIRDPLAGGKIGVVRSRTPTR